ncbi:MAG: MFS transporter [Archangium gephyra]|uniref:MFS transporter n=1 Tax=Archangium gephyra TaxID=48 RepID=A0A2W5TYU5_9BACT|nr:MAG: MFS transporter [Archangium gephyra]
MPAWLSNLLPILLLLGAIALVLWRLPSVELGHSEAFKRRRFWNWFPLGMVYAFLYFGRYNVNALTSALGSNNKEFGIIFAVGTIIYGVSFLINGPLTDKLGGRTTILISALGAALSNLAMAAVVYAERGAGLSLPGGLMPWLAVLYALDMYFQSFGAVSIVKVNAAWFHVRERGVQGGVFGILISLGVYFGYDWSEAIAKGLPTQPWMIALIPAVVLLAAFAAAFALVRDNPSDTGHPDFEVGDDSSAIDEKANVVQVFVKMLTNPVILVIVGIEFCTGFLRNGVMSWYPKFSKAVEWQGDFVSKNWGLLLCVFGIIGGMFAGLISDKVFHSRRGPVASVLYGGITAGAIAMYFGLTYHWVGWVLIFMALNYVGVHGMLSGTASADFGGKKNAGVAVGIIDGFVYLGTGLQSLIVSRVLPEGDAAKIPANWINWPTAMVPVAVVGLLLCTRVWNARPQSKNAPH